MEEFRSSDEADEKDLKKSKKRKGLLRAFTVKPKPVDAAPPENPEDIWQKLSLIKRRAGTSEASLPLTDIEPASPTHAAEVSAAAAPLETLSSEERQYVTREIVNEMQQSTGETGAIQPVDEADVESVPELVPEAVATFRDKIVNDDLDAEQAFTETLHQFGADVESTGTKTDEVASEPIVSLSLDADGAQHKLTAIDQTPSLREDSGAIFAESIATERSISAFGGDSSSRDLPTWLTTAASYHPPSSPRTREATIATKEHMPRYNDRHTMQAALTGGIIGYLIGRRRGRIKAERKLLPIQEKLKKQVDDLRQDIQYKERYIRKITHQRRHDRQKIFDMERDKPDTQSEPSRQIAMEANQLHGKKVLPERIGRVLMVAEDQPAVQGEVDKHEKAASKQLTDKRIDTMSRAELLELSGKINVENTNLRHIYETHLIGEQGLRRLIGEHMQGGNVQKILRQELAEHERDFERDPILRDRAQASGGAAGSETLSQLLEKAEVLTSTEAKNELAVLKARQAHQESQRTYQQQRRRVLDVSIVTAIIVLFVLVITLLIAR